LNNLLNVLKAKYVGKENIYFEEIDSTQKEIWRRIDKKQISNGTVIMAGIQTDGIGTHQRTWYKENKDNIAFSICLFPNLTIDKLDNFTYEIAEILVKVFQDLYNIKIDIKRPNDLIINNKKIGGILTETKIYGNIVKYLVIGIGINTNGTEKNKEIENISTSINEEFNIKIDNFKVITYFCDLLECNLEKRIGEKA
jgi:BirA family biotin operon repressor/biotin-[acetyl-CoA-carboxylase] ligase